MILVTGVNGQLGYDVVKRLQALDMPCKGIDIADLDLTDGAAVSAYLHDLKPTAVVHCAAYTAVDNAEDQADLCRAVNVDATRTIATVCKELDSVLMYISTDYVFAGTGDTFQEVDAPLAPSGVYGKTKLDGELAVQELLSRFFIVRISWVFGKNGNNFVKTMLRLGKERDTLSVVGDQIGSPTYTADLAVLLCDMLKTDRYGVYHATNEGVCSWAEFAAAIMQKAGLSCTIQSIPSSDYPTKATRPLNSRLSKTALETQGFCRLPHWEDALDRYLKEIAPW